MKQSDILIILVILLIAGILFVSFEKEDTNNMIAKVYYEDELKLTIDLNENKEYDVEGYNGNVHIVVEDKKIKVEEENSPKHLCSKQGFISSSYQTIVCLPNKIVIRVEDDNSIDAVIG